VRRAEGVFLVEGVRLVEEALKTGQSATIALYDPELLQRSTAGSLLLERIPGWAERSYEVTSHVLKAAAQTEHPAGVVAVLRSPHQSPLEAHQDDRFGVILDGVADPGNAGTIIRTSAAAGVDYVISVGGGTDLFAPKVVRAGMGAHFRLPMYSHTSWSEIVLSLPRMTLIAADVRAEESIYSFSWPSRSALVIGAEAHGLSNQAQSAISGRVRIPMVGGVESLNAAAAASIVIYTALGPGISSEDERYR